MGGERGGRRRARPSRSAHPTGTTQPAREQPPDTDTPHRARHHGTPPTNTRPNLSNQREPRPRPQVENNPARTQPARQATRKTNPPHRKELHPTDTHQPTDTTTQQRDDPNQDPQPTKRMEAGVKEGSKGNRTPDTTPPTNQEPGPTNQTPPPNRHPNPRTQHQLETRHQSQPPPTLRPPHHLHPTRYPAHMPWDTSDRRQRLPTNWNKIRKQVLAKAKHRCAGLDPATTPPPTRRKTAEGHHRWHHPACDMRATDVDHINAGDNHELDNLQALSHACHTAKTTHENTAAKARIRATATRERPPHPCARATQTNKKEKQNETKAKTNENITRTEAPRRETWN